jgi:hypothetical protein
MENGTAVNAVVRLRFEGAYKITLKEASYEDFRKAKLDALSYFDGLSDTEFRNLLVGRGATVCLDGVCPLFEAAHETGKTVVKV